MVILVPFFLVVLIRGANYVQFTIHCAIYTLNLYSIFDILHMLYTKLYTLYSMLCTIHHILYIIDYALCTLYSIL